MVVVVVVVVVALVVAVAVTVSLLLVVGAGAGVDIVFLRSLLLFRRHRSYVAIYVKVFLSLPMYSTAHIARDIFEIPSLNEGIDCRHPR